MASIQKTIVMIQPSKRQGQIWQAALNSQKISVIWEASDVDLALMLSRMKEAGMPGPDLLLLDVGVLSCNPYAFCRWCREHHPEQKIILTNVNQREISPPERQWAIYQGAIDLLPGFQRETLLTGVTTAITRVMTAIDESHLNQEALIQVLFSITSLQNGSKSRHTPPPSEDTLAARATPEAYRKSIPQQLVTAATDTLDATKNPPKSTSETPPVKVAKYPWKSTPEEETLPEVEAEPVEKPVERRRSYRGVMY